MSAMGTIEWTDKQLSEIGVSRTELEKLLKKLSTACNHAKKMGLMFYVTPTAINLIHESRPHHDKSGWADEGSVVGLVTGNFDGGDW